MTSTKATILATLALAALGLASPAIALPQPSSILFDNTNEDSGEQTSSDNDSGDDNSNPSEGPGLRCEDGFRREGLLCVPE